MPDPGPPPPVPGDLLDELGRLVPDLPTSTLLELADRIDELAAEEHLRPEQVEQALSRLLTSG